MRRRIKHQFSSGSKYFILIGFIIFIAVFIVVQLNNKILPSAIAISHLQAQNKSNIVIDTAVKNSIAEMNIKSSDFIIDNNDSKITSFSANTILINELCSTVSENIVKEIEKIKDENIEVPLGVVMGLDTLANIGPNITFNLREQGAADVDYETAFNAVGINQTNFKIWINVKIMIQIVNPLRQETISMQRKLMLVDTVINGEVPGTYMDFNGGIK